MDDVTESVVEIKLDDYDNPSEFLIVRHTCPEGGVIERLGKGFNHIMRTVDLDDEYDDDHEFSWQDFRWEHGVILNNDWTPVLPIEGIISVQLGLDNWIGEVHGDNPLVYLCPMAED